MAYDNDQGGAIDDEAPDISQQQAPPVEDDATGVNQAQQQQQPTVQPQQQLSQPQGPLAPLAKRIISYLSGAAAAPPESIDEVARQVDPQGALSPADRNIMALDKIREQGGDQAAWPILQANRVAYNAKTAFAKTALTGTPQKPANLHAALLAANQAQTHVLDGSNVVFSQHNGMVTAMVTGPGSSQAEHIQLTPQAFGKFLDVGGDGQWDKVMEHSAPETLKRLAATGGPRPGQGGMTQLPQSAAPQAQQQQQQPQQAQAAGGDDDDDEDTITPAQPGGENLPVAGSPEALRMGDDYRHEQRLAAGGGKQPFARSGDAFPGNDMQFAGNDPADERSSRRTNDRGSEQAVPGTHDRLGHYRGPQQRDPNGYGEDLEKRSRSIFPGVGQEDKRQEWMAAQEQQGKKNEIDMKRAGHEYTVDAARIRAAGGVESAKIKANGAAVIQQQKALEAARKMEMNHQDASMRERGRMARSEMSNPNFVLQDDATRAKILQKYGIQTGDAQAPAPAGNQPQQQQQPQSVPAVNQRVTGQVYTTPKGQFKWMGNGWQPVQ